jgi:hypothetical protein
MLEAGLQQNALSLVLPLVENGPLDLDVSARAAGEPGVLQSVPEPGTLLSFGSVMAGLGIARRRCMRARRPEHFPAGILRH